MTEIPTQAPVQLVFDGAFPARVAAAAAEALDATHEVRLVRLSEAGAEPTDLMSAGQVTVLITPRFDWHEVHRFDVASHRVKRPWCFIGYVYPYVFVGPLVTPYDGPCYSCLRDRLKQHGRTEIPLEGVHVPAPEAHIEGIPGYLVYSVSGLLAGLLSTAEHPRVRPVQLLHVNGLKVRSEALVGVHGCRRCADPAGNRPGSGGLLTVYRELWEG